jgi:diguanylate cyclase (GGDEF)-like protein/PAS domain S-box-containing protein
MQRSERVAVFQLAALALSASTTELEVVNILVASMQALCANGFWVALYEPSTDTVDVRFWHDDAGRVAQREVRQRGGVGLGGEVARLGVTIATDDYVRECARRGVPVDQPAPWITDVNIPWLGVPLMGPKQVLGILCSYAYQSDVTDDCFIEVLQKLAAHASASLGSIRRRAGELVQRAELEARVVTLQESEARYRTLVELSPDAIVVHVDGLIVYANLAAGSLFGAARPEQLLGAPVLNLVHADSRAGVAQRVRELQLVGAEVPVAEERLVRVDGTPIEAEIAASAVSYQGRHAIQVVVRDIFERKRNRELLEHQASHDGLTGLPNRRLFTQRLTEALASVLRRRRRIAIMFLNLDDFKMINDSLSHQHGDRVLQELARRLMNSVSIGDTVARLGGDEFAVLLNDVRSKTQVRRTAERIRRVVSKPVVIGERIVSTHPSIGIALSDRTLDPDLLLRNADLAMYEGKAAGKNRTVIFDAMLETRLLERLDLERELSGALESRQLEVHYQPLYELATGGLVGAEALLRWHHPRWGLVAPDRFIPIAELTGLIVPIGLWVMEQACAQTRSWLNAATVSENFEISVNVSGLQLQTPGLADDLAGILERTGLEAGRLVLEVTESTAMGDVQASFQALHRLKALGVRLAIDDFGTGYSSLSHLKHFPIDILKIDRSFVSGSDADGHDRAIIRAVVTLARSLRLSVTAEGIETADQLAFLRDLGCDQGQGYLLGRPAPPAKLQRVLLDAASSHGASRLGVSVPARQRKRSRRSA